MVILQLLPKTAQSPRGLHHLHSARTHPEVKGGARLDMNPYFCKHRNMPATQTKKSSEQIAKYADMFSAMGTEPRLRIMQLLLSAHPEGLVVGDIQGELEIPNSTLSHHLDKLKNEGLVLVQRESTFLRYTASTEALQELLQFLYSECCTRNKALKPRDIVEICK
jgi:ArsR family transcriptional regulator, arsenate/arsenite/antimonite-responsive transcriptional repressor